MAPIQMRSHGPITWPCVCAPVSSLPSLDACGFVSKELDPLKRQGFPFGFHFSTNYKRFKSGFKSQKKSTPMYFLFAAFWQNLDGVQFKRVQAPPAACLVPVAPGHMVVGLVISATPSQSPFK